MGSSIIEDDLEYITTANLPWNEFKGRTILVSGANGFLPSYMVETLLYLNEIKNRYDIKIIGLVRNLGKASDRFSKYANRSDLQLMVQDICKPLIIDEKIDFIIHAASQASPKFYGTDPVGTLCANTVGTYNLLNLARNKYVKGFLFFSSSEVYGKVDQSQMPIREDSYGYVDPTDLRSCYAESKRMGETMCVSWFHQYDVPAKIVRPFHTYGPGMSLNDGRVYADFIADLLNCRDIVMKSDGSNIRAFCYLADAVLGFFTVLLKGECGQPYNIGNNENAVSISRFADIIANLFPEKGLKVIRQESSVSRNYLPSSVSKIYPDTSKVYLLGWKPKYSLEQGLIRTVQWFGKK